MQLQITDGYITGYAVVGGFPDGVEVDDSFKDQLEDEKLSLIHISEPTRPKDI